MLEYPAPKRLNIFLAFTLAALIAVNVFFGYQYFKLRTELIDTKAQIKQQGLNNKVLDFASFFIQSVLQAEEVEIDFETRLKLESAVRDLGNEEILSSWKRFVNAPDDNTAQKEVKALLFLLINSIKK